MQSHADGKMKGHEKHHYTMLAWMGLLHLVIMYLVMFSMIDTRNDFYNNVNMLYMAVMMAAPMVILMPLMMRSMYQNKKLNAVFIGGAAVLFLGAFAFIRDQTGVGDKQFLRSMIPHHSGAILMCEDANIQDMEIKDLCGRIIQSQREEIEQMKKIRDRLKGASTQAQR